MQLNKRDLITIVVLSVIFLSLATYNLGSASTPVITAQVSSGQSFVVNLGSLQDVQSVYFLIKDGSFNLNVSVGSPDNWQQVTTNHTFEDYYKWNEVNLQRSTQYIKVDFNPSTSATLAEVAVSNQADQQIPIAAIDNAGTGNADWHNLFDEQDKVQLPITYMEQTYFDEIYFVKTAEQYLNHQWPYEWTHPPLGKLIQAGGIAMFGFSPFGWRLMGVIFATLMIPVMYFLGKKLFGSWIGGFAAAFLLTFDFMHFTMGRMGTADTYVVFFALLSELFFLIYFQRVVKEGWKTSVLPLFLAVIFFALGFSTKWLVIYSAVGMLVLLAALRFRDIRKLKIGWGAKYAAFFDHPFLLLMGFIAVAVGIYFLTYIPDMLIGRPLLGANGNGVIDLQFAMYSYHANLVATHAFASPWWSWPFMVNPTPGAYVPLWLAISYLPNNIHSTISVFGNPAVWWVGFASVIAISLEVAGVDDLSSRLWAKIRKKPTVPNREYTDEGEGENPTNGASHHGNTKTIAVGFLIFVLTAIISEIINYHTFLLAVPLYAGMFLAVYGMVSNLEGKHSLKDIAPIFIVSVFFFSWLPYTFISRVTFIYHFYVSMPFLCLGSAYFISKYWSTRKGKVAAVALFASVIVLFGVFYPVISGAPTPVSYLDHLKWFGSWYF